MARRPSGTLVMMWAELQGRLGITDNARITAIRIDPITQLLVMVVEHPKLPKVEAADQPQYVTMTEVQAL